MKQFVISMMLAFVVGTALANDKKESRAAETKAPATVAVSGSVTDQNTNETLVGVKVELEGTGLVTYTDFDGNYSFENVKPGLYDLTASYVSYEKKCVGQIKLNEEKSQVMISLKASN